MLKSWIVIFTLFVFFAVWEVCSRTYQELNLVLPAPSLIVGRIFESPERFWMHTKATLYEMLAGFLLSFAAAFPLAWIMNSWTSARAIFQPLFIFIQCIPMFTLAPLMVIWFGWTANAVIVPIALMIVFPLTINIYQGLKATPKHLIDYFKIHQATPFQILMKLEIPWAKDHIFAGIRIAAAVAGIGAIAGEWAGAQEGLGLLMIESRRATDLETTFGALFCLTLLSLTFYGVIAMLENTVFTRKFLRAVFMSFSALIFLASCGKSDNKTRLLLDWLPNPNHVPLYAGVEKGFFKDAGIDLSILKIQDPSDSLPYLTSGQAELALYYMPDTVRAMKRGVDIQIAGVLFKQPLNCFMFLKGGGISKPQDLNGKVIGYSVDGNTTLVLKKLLANQNIVPKELRNVTFDLVSTLGSQKVDAVYGAYWNIETVHLQSLGMEAKHFDLLQFGNPNYYELVVLAHSKQPKEKIEAFQKALQKSIDYSVSHPNEAFDAYLKANPDKSLKTKAWEKKAWEITYPLLALNQIVDPAIPAQFSAWIDTLGTDAGANEAQR